MKAKTWSDGIMEKSRRPTLLQLQVSLPKKIAVTAGIMLILIFFVYRFAVPNPNMILIAGLVLCSALFGFGGGIVAAAIMLGYTLFFFSTDHSLIHFTPQNLQKVAVSLFGVAADMLLVCFLKQSELRAFGEVHSRRTRGDRHSSRVEANKKPRSALESRRVSLGAHWVDSRESSLLRRLERGREIGL